jgi:hypothetical protein
LYTTSTGKLTLGPCHPIPRIYQQVFKAFAVVMVITGKVNANHVWG